MELGLPSVGLHLALVFPSWNLHREPLSFKCWQRFDAFRTCFEPDFLSCLLELIRSYISRVLQLRCKSTKPHSIYLDHGTPGA